MALEELQARVDETRKAAETARQLVIGFVEQSWRERAANLVREFVVELQPDVTQSKS